LTLLNDFFRENRSVRILMCIENTEKRNVDLMKECDTTYAHVSKIVQELIVDGLITSRKDGRERYNRATSKGLKLMEKLDEIQEILE
jgi:predicted transcriptional regulator